MPVNSTGTSKDPRCITNGSCRSVWFLCNSTVVLKSAIVLCITCSSVRHRCIGLFDFPELFFQADRSPVVVLPAHYAEGSARCQGHVLPQRCPSFSHVKTASRQVLRFRWSSNRLTRTSSQITVFPRLITVNSHWSLSAQSCVSSCVLTADSLPSQILRLFLSSLMTSPFFSSLTCCFPPLPHRLISIF